MISETFNTDTGGNPYYEITYTTPEGMVARVRVPANARYNADIVAKLVAMMAKRMRLVNTRSTARLTDGTYVMLEN